MREHNYAVGCITYTSNQNKRVAYPIGRHHPRRVITYSYIYVIYCSKYNQISAMILYRKDIFRVFFKQLLVFIYNSMNKYKYYLYS